MGLVVAPRPVGLCLLLASALASAGAVVASYTAAAEHDRVDVLPGWGKPAFGLFSGYITVDEQAGRALFYAFVESTTDPASAPLVLWLNGGPGCSSLAGGFLSELGPFYPTPNGAALQANKYNWNQAANIIFLESPAFVGWSYSNTSLDSNVGDKRTAADARQFVLGFLERFPQYVGRPFWISGESYGGHYVPNLAYEIVTNNNASGPPAINLQGFLVGNAWTDPALDNQGAVDFWWSHAIISDATRAGLYKFCDFRATGPLTAAELAANASFDSKACDTLTGAAMSEMGSINIYDIYADVCQPSPAAAEVRQFASVAGASPRALAARVDEHRYSKGMYDPCIDAEVETYFNRPDVQLALHANTSRHRLPYAWTQCAGAQLNYSREDVLTSVLPVYRVLLKSDLRMLVFSGDVDGIVPVIGTRRWIDALELPNVQPWRPWASATGQVGGYVQQYQGLTLATVRDAGHMVPYTQPERALYLFKSWLETAAAPGDGVLHFLGGSGRRDTQDNE